MTTVHETSTFNVEASMNKWLQDGLADITKPSWLPAYTLALNFPQGGITPPCFSVAHIPVHRMQLWQGDYVGDGKTGRRAAALMEVSVWVTRQNSAYMAQAMAMLAMLDGLVAGTQTIPLYNYWGNPAAPVLTAYKIDIGEMTISETAPDPNPDIYRRRALIRYDWVVRSNQ
jgi:hypothetical protein